jgi:hypothetical protein
MEEFECRMIEGVFDNLHVYEHEKLTKYQVILALKGLDFSSSNHLQYYKSRLIFTITEILLQDKSNNL